MKEDDRGRNLIDEFMKSSRCGGLTGLNLEKDEMIKNYISEKI